MKVVNENGVEIHLSIGDILRSWMKAKHVTMEEAAKKLGMSRVNFSWMVNGRANKNGVHQPYDPPFSRICQIADMMGIEQVDLIRLMTGDIPLSMGTWQELKQQKIERELRRRYDHLSDDEIKEIAAITNE